MTKAGRSPVSGQGWGPAVQGVPCTGTCTHSETPKLPPDDEILYVFGVFFPKFVHFMHFSHALPCLDGACLQHPGSIWRHTADDFLMPSRLVRNHHPFSGRSAENGETMAGLQVAGKADKWCPGESKYHPGHIAGRKAKNQP